MYMKMKDGYRYLSCNLVTELTNKIMSKLLLVSLTLGQRGILDILDDSTSRLRIYDYLLATLSATSDFPSIPHTFLDIQHDHPLQSKL
jgi:hypothetical protein